MKSYILLLLSFSFLAQPILAKKRFSVRSEYKKGRKLYLGKKYLNASYVLANILKKYPSHEPSAVLLARIYYRVKNYNSAGALFSKMVPQNLEPIEQYEYGHVEAEYALRHSIVLPTRLSKRRKIYLRHVRSILLTKERNKLRRAERKAARIANKEDRKAAIIAERAERKAERLALRRMKDGIKKDLEDEKILPPMVTVSRAKKQRKL